MKVDKQWAGEWVENHLQSSLSAFYLLPTFISCQSVAEAPVSATAQVYCQEKGNKNRKNRNKVNTVSVRGHIYNIVLIQMMTAIVNLVDV